MRFKHIIFDLGGVVLPVDYQRCVRAFEALGVPHFDDLYAQALQSPLFDELELGQITPAAFRDGLRTLMAAPQLTDAQLDLAWNAILGEWDRDRLDLLLELKRRYRTFLLSNTNAIHEARFLHTLSWAFEREGGLEAYFEKVYLSHHIHLRKPNPEVFLYVLNQNGLLAQDTLFIDDSPQHIEAASALGIQTLLLEPGNSILEVFDGL